MSSGRGFHMRVQGHAGRREVGREWGCFSVVLALGGARGGCGEDRGAGWTFGGGSQRTQGRWDCWSLLCPPGGRGSSVNSTLTKSVCGGVSLSWFCHLSGENPPNQMCRVTWRDLYFVAEIPGEFLFKKNQ